MIKAKTIKLQCQRIQNDLRLRLSRCRTARTSPCLSYMNEWAIFAYEFRMEPCEKVLSMIKKEGSRRLTKAVDRKLRRADLHGFFKICSKVRGDWKRILKVDNPFGVCWSDMSDGKIELEEWRGQNGIYPSFFFELHIMKCNLKKTRIYHFDYDLADILQYFCYGCGVGFCGKGKKASIFDRGLFASKKSLDEKLQELESNAWFCDTCNVRRKSSISLPLYFSKTTFAAHRVVQVRDIADDETDDSLLCEDEVIEKQQVTTHHTLTYTLTRLYDFCNEQLDMVQKYDNVFRKIYESILHETRNNLKVLVYIPNP